VASTYRFGILTIVATLFVSALACWARVGAQPAPVRAAQELESGHFPLGDFELVERSGRPVTQADLADRVCIASFIFTRCPLSCPRITGVMKDISAGLAATDVLLLSLSVDPEYDTPTVLAAYARRFEASPERWWFLTGPKDTIYELVRDRFKLTLMDAGPTDPASEREAITHSDRLALVDRGQIVGLYESTDAHALDSLIARARQLALPRWVRLLPTINASLNAACAAFLIAGWILIRSRARLIPTDERNAFLQQSAVQVTQLSAIRRHMVCMIAALAASVLFLTSYLVYHYQAGSVPFRGAGPVRLCYFTILVSHSFLAAVGVVPLVIVTVMRAWRRDFIAHRRVAQITFPIWLYVSITGVIIYAMLYHLPQAGRSL
jgi:protein SCO1/2/putative membrane protein